jgi:hypothetical protein
MKNKKNKSLGLNERKNFTIRSFETKSESKKTKLLWEFSVKKNISEFITLIRGKS